MIMDSETAADRAETVLTLADQKRTAEFAAHFAKNARLKFGNQDAVIGREQVEDLAEQVLSKFERVDHEVVRAGATGSTDWWGMMVTYTRHDGTQVTVPAASLVEYTYEADKYLIQDYQVYVDLTPVLA